MQMTVRSRLLASTLFAGAVMIASQATAQTAPATKETQQVSQDPNTPPPAEEGQDIVVTGTLISNPNLVSSSPVAVVSENELALRNINNVEQVIRELPGAVAVEVHDADALASGAQLGRQDADESEVDDDRAPSRPPRVDRQVGGHDRP